LNIDRLLRDVEARLAAWDGPRKLEVMDALREALARERRSLDPSFSVESERERRQNAEELRGALEAIHRSVRSSEALEEVLKQLDRVVPTDFAVLAVAEPGAGLRISAVRGAEPQVFEGALVADDSRVTLAREERIAVAVCDAEADKAPFPLVGAPPMRSWIALPLLLEGDVVGMLVAGRHELDTFSNEDVQRAKAVASWTAATPIPTSAGMSGVETPPPAMTSTRPARSRAASCRSVVARQMVCSTRTSLALALSRETIASTRSCRCVVWATTPTRSRGGSASTSS